MNVTSTSVRLANQPSASGSVTLIRDGLSLASSSVSPGTNVTVLSLMACVRRRWRQATILGAVLGAMAFAFIWVYLPPAKPFAYTKIYFPTKPPGSVEHPDPPVNPQTQRELITSRVVLKAVLNDPEVAALDSTREKTDALGWLIQNVAVDFPSGSEICRITLTEDNALDARIVVDKIARIYLSQMGLESTEYRNVQLAKLREMVDSARKDLHGELGSSRAPGTDGFTSSTPEIMAQRQQMINNQLVQLDSDVKKIRSLVEQARNDEKRLSARLEKLPITLSQAEFDPLFAQNSAATNLRQLRHELQVDYENRLAGLGPDNPSMLALKNRIQSVEGQLQRLKDELRTAIAAGFQEKMTEDLRKAREEITRLHFEEKEKLNETTLKQTEFEKLKDATTNAGRFRPGLASKGARLEELQSKLAKLEAEITAPVAARLLEEEAIVVRPNDSSRRMKMSAIAAMACFGGVFLLLGFLEFREHRVVSPTEASDIGLRLVGTIPRQRASGSGMSNAQWESLLNESVDATRTVFLHAARVSNLRTVLVSSAVGGEGKTSLCTRLASSLARSGRRTLLIDGDLRNPSIHQYLAGRPETGVCEVLRGEKSVSETIVAATQENLWALPAGRCDKSAIQALSLDGFAGILAEANQRDFDFILIDSAPLLPVADTLLIARHTDGVLLSMMVDVSQVERVDVACKKLASLDIPLLGTVVQGIRSRTSAYGPVYAAAIA